MDKKELMLRAAFQTLFSALAGFMDIRRDQDEDSDAVSIIQNALFKVGNELYPLKDAKDIFKQWRVWSELRNGRDTEVGIEYVYEAADGTTYSDHHITLKRAVTNG